MRNIKFYIFICFLFWATISKAQDPHFSQFYMSPLSLNPAMAGLMKEDMRFIANYRSQWASVSVPYKTMSISADMSVLDGKLGNNILGVGLFLMNDKAGTSEMRNTQAQLAVAYSKSLNAQGNTFLSVGGQIGVVQQSVDHSKLIFDSQYDGDILNPNLNTGEEFERTSFWYADATAGVAWSFVPDKYNSYYAGVSMAHINEPKVGFTTADSELLYRKITMYLGAEIRLNGIFSVIPRMVYLKQGPSKEVNFGGLLKLNVSKLDATTMQSLYFGTMHRMNDAQIVILRYDYGNWGVGLSYDVNISTLEAASNFRGGFEIGIVYKSTNTEKSKQKPIGCPVF